MTVVLLTHADDTEARAARTVTAEGQSACPFCDPLGSRVSGPLCRLPAWAGADEVGQCLVDLVGRREDGYVEAGLPPLVADLAAVQEIDVVGLVQEVIHRGRPVGRDTRREALENAVVDAIRIVVRLNQERQQRNGQHGRLTLPEP